MDLPVKQSKYIGLDTKNDKVENHTRAVDKDLANLFLYTQKLPQAGITEDITIAGVVYHYVNGVITGHTP